MQTNAPITASFIFAHVDIFFELLDSHADESKNNARGFKISTYEFILQKYVAHHTADENDRKRILKTLSLDNLKHCELLAFINPQKGSFNLRKDLLSMIVGFDSKRLRELGQPDLDIIYSQIKTFYDYFQQKNGHFSHLDIEFMENLTALIDTLQEIFAKIQHNVRALEGSSKRLSEIVDSHDLTKIAPTLQLNEAFAEILKIYQRNIMPTLSFLNEQAMAQDSSAMYLIRKIREMLENTTFYEEVSTISTIEMRLLSFTEVISDIRRKLHRYIDMNREQRKLYNAIERQYNELNLLVINELDSKLTGKILPSTHSFFNPSLPIQHLITWSRSLHKKQLMSLPQDGNPSLAYELIRTKLEQVNAFERPKTTPKEITLEEHRSRLLKRQHVSHIKKLMESFIFPENSDLYLAIHEHLIDHLPDYRLQDIYDAKAFIPKDKNIITHLQRNTIEYRQQALSYPIKSLQG